MTNEPARESQPAQPPAVKTWDMDLQKFTPQIGVPPGPYTLFGLRRALRALQGMGYETSRAGGFNVLVERRDA